MAGAGSREDPYVLSDDDEESPASAIPVVDVPASELSIALRIQESGIVPGQPGLYTMQMIPANTFVCCYVFDRVMTDEEIAALPTDRRAAVARYAVAAPVDKTLIIQVPIVDRTRFVAAMANEPASSQAANMALHAEEVALPDGRVYYVVALYSCDAPIPAGAELTWFCAWVGLDLCDRALPLVPYVSLVCLRRRPIVRPS